ncbi:MAG: hypothetical protein HYZ17_12420 [Betaproteobacteria bacterium]|nr:hypothetical protein [Betaproteobacteria bacterium]
MEQRSLPEGIMRAVTLTVLLLLLPGAARADKYIMCDDSVRSGLECFVTALDRAYEYCRQVESIVIIEFGVDEANAGTNGAKLAACAEKYHRDLKPSYVAALKEMAKHRGLTERVKQAHTFWAESIKALAPQSGESDVDYKVRVMAQLDHLRDRAAELKAELAERASALAQKAASKLKKKS